MIFQCLHRHFSAWYNIVLERRLHIGKAKALFDWKLLLKAFNVWKAFVRSHRIDIETKQHEMDVISTHRYIYMYIIGSHKLEKASNFGGWR